jgi:hypothetical protein
MIPVNFEGAIEIKKPSDMTDEQCMSIWAKRGVGKLFEIINLKNNGVEVEIIPPVVAGVDTDKYQYFLTAWKPSYEDLKALNRGEPVYVKTLSTGLPPMALFTLDENNEANF